MMYIIAIVLVGVFLYFKFRKKKKEKVNTWVWVKTNQTDREVDFLNRINQYLKDAGLGALLSDGRIQNTAKENSVKWNDKGGRMTHEGAGERQRLLMYLGANHVSELVVGGYSTDDKSFLALIDSEKHESKIVSDYKYIGVGISGRYYTIILVK